MATPVIFKGDDTDFKGGSPITVNLATPFTLDGCKVILSLLGVRREYTGLSGRSANLAVKFTAEETKSMPVGTFRATLRVFDADGRARTALDDIPFRVTDSIAEAYGGGEQEIEANVEAVADPAKLLEGENLDTNSVNGLRAAVEKIAESLGATVSVLALAVLPAFGGIIHTAPLGELDLDKNPHVVTNVTFDEVDFSAGNSALAGTIGSALGQFAATGSVATAQSADTAKYLREGETNFSASAFFESLHEALNAAAARAFSVGTPTRWMDATGCVWEVTADKAPWTGGPSSPLLWSDEQGGWLSDPSTDLLTWSSGTWQLASGTLTTTFTCSGEWGAMRLVLHSEGPAPDVILERGLLTNLVGRVALTSDIAEAEIDPTVPSWAKASSKPSYSASEVGAYPAADGNQLADVVNLWEGYWGGTNVVFEVTNYYNATSGELPRLRIRELRGGVWTNVWDEVDKFNVCEAGILAHVAASNSALLAEVREGFAPKEWGAYTDKGTTNVIGNSVWMTSPETYFAGGTEYQRVAVGDGAICVLVRNGADVYTAGEAGTFRFQDAGGTNYFGFAK